MTPLREELAGKTQTSLIVLLGASAAVLLIACVNLANLLLSRGAVRRREVAVRAALGAGRGRLITQFLIESLVLAGLGAVAGLALAIPVMRFLETLVPETMAAVRLTLDWRVLAFSAAHRHRRRIDVRTCAGARRIAARVAGRTARRRPRQRPGARSHWFQHSLIVIETALAVVLLTSGGLLLQTFQHLRQLDLGIRSENLLTFVTPLFRYRDFDQARGVRQRGVGKDPRDSRRHQRRRDFANPADGQRPVDVLYLSPGQSDDRSPRAGSRSRAS